MNTELERIWKEAVIEKWRQCPGIYLQRLRNCAEGFSRDSYYTSRDSNGAPSEWKTGTIPLRQQAHYFFLIIILALIIFILFLLSPFCSSFSSILTLNSSIMFISFPHSSLCSVKSPSFPPTFSARSATSWSEATQGGNQMHRTSWQWKSKCDHKCICIQVLKLERSKRGIIGLPFFDKRMERPRQNQQNLNQDSWYIRFDSNSAPPKYKSQKCSRRIFLVSWI